MILKKTVKVSFLLAGLFFANYTFDIFAFKSVFAKNKC